MIPTNLRTETSRTAAERLATKYIAANDNAVKKVKDETYRGTRPAMNWAIKNDEIGAACLWLIARQRLPDSMVVANDNEPVQGGLDTRRNGTARGKSKMKRDLGAHLSLPAVIPRLGDAEPVRDVDQVQQESDADYLPDSFRSWGSCGDAVASLGIDFIGAESGLGSPRPGKSRGSPLRAEEPDFGEPPTDVDYVIELLMARQNVSEIGEAFGAKGRYQDKKGAAMLEKAMAWARQKVIESNYRANVTNRVA